MPVSGNASAVVNGEPINVGFRIGLDSDSMWDAGWYWLAYGDGQKVYSHKAHYMLADTGGVDTVEGSLCGLRWMSFDTPCDDGCDGCDKYADLLCKTCRKLQGG